MFQKRFKAILFDLFGTVIHFAPRVPTGENSDDRRRVMMGWMSDIVQRELPAVRFEDFLHAVMEISGEINRGRAPEYLEVSCPERFRRALCRLGVSAGVPDIAQRLAEVHMQHLAAQTLLPDAHTAVLQQLRRRHRLALISNFDHAATARAILEHHDVATYFDPIVISDAFGRRKPHAAIFEGALRHMGLQAGDAIYVGDSLADDVAGARNAGLAVIWINAERAAMPSGPDAPDAVIERLTELPALLLDPS